MSDVTPPQEPTEPTVALEQPDPYVAPAPARRRRLGVVGVVAVVVVAVLVGGAYAVYALLNGGGPKPAEALPASTVAIISIDLNPSASQKIAAIKTIRKFPALKKSLGLQADDDLRRFIFDRATRHGSCSSLDYDRDVKPWAGKRAALAAVDLGAKNPVPAIALQVTDPAKARADFAKVAKCAGTADDLGYAVGDDYLIASDSTAHAEAIVAAAKKHPLSDDPAYQKWTDEAGDAGVINFYVAKSAVSYLGQILDSFRSGIAGTAASSASSALPGGSDQTAAIKNQLKGFRGLAGTVRFAGGGMELSFASSAGRTPGGAGVGPQVTALPQDTAIALGFAVPKSYTKAFSQGFGGDAGADGLDQLQSLTGLTLPGDLTDLLGSAITLSLGGDAPADLNDLNSPASLPVGIVVHGNAAKARAVLAKLENHLGFRLSDVPVIETGNSSELVLSPSRAYAAALEQKGTLGDSSGFRDAVPHTSDAAAILYVDFNSAWRAAIVKLVKDSGGSVSGIENADANTKPLRSLGISSWRNGTIAHGLIKLTTD
ncbi:MAG: hypothetical protein JWP74_1592 [Marmoricola sp.]|nr:hypothetical protein [Marmoricola sp.]